MKRFSLVPQARKGATWLVLVLLLRPCLALADEPDAAEKARIEEARQHFERGLDLSDAQNWDEALAELLLSKKIYPSRPATINIGLCLRALKRYDEALKAFEELSAIAELPPDERAYVDKQVTALKKLVGTVSVEVSEPGAMISLDGRQVGESPLPSPLRVSVGSRVLRVTKNGFEPSETRFEVAGRQSVTLHADLRPLSQSGWLKIDEANDKRLEVLVDGISVGRTPFRGLVPPGPHVVVLVGEGRTGTLPTQTTVQLNQVTPLLLFAEELTSTLRIFPAPAEANVIVDGVAVGRGRYEGKLRPGPHRVEVSAEGYTSRVETVETVANREQTAEIALEPPTGVPRWWRGARAFAEVNADFALLAALGGDIAASCGEGCGGALGRGFVATARGGFGFPGGFSFAIEAGYFSARQSYWGRPAQVIPTGFSQNNNGKTSETLDLRGARLGIAPGFHSAEGIPFSFRLGIGAFLGEVVDRRGGKFVNVGTAAGSSYDVAVFDIAQTNALYLAPELSFGVRLGDHWEVLPQLGVMALFVPSAPRWGPADALFLAGKDGQGRFADERLTGPFVFVLTTGLGLRWEP